jgi:hypothetical protein
MLGMRFMFVYMDVVDICRSSCRIYLAKVVRTSCNVSVPVTEQA